eukprot:11223811-Lingulodinium_polyedra.AAC.1
MGGIGRRPLKTKRLNKKLSAILMIMSLLSTACGLANCPPVGQNARCTLSTQRCAHAAGATTRSHALTRTV